MAEYSRFAKGSYTVPTGVTQPIYLPFQPTAVHLLNATTFATNTANLVNEVWWDVALGQGTALMTFVGASATYYLSTDTVTTSGISTFSNGLSLQYGPQVQIVSATAASPAVFTVASGAGPAVGDVVVFEGLYQSSTTGMIQMCGMPFKVSAATATTFTVVWTATGSNYTALSASPTGAYYRKVLNPYLYLPGVTFISAINTSTSLITTTTNHNYVVGQEVAFRIPSAWGTTQLNSLPNNSIPGSPIYGYVTAVNSNTTFTVNISMTGYTAFNPNVTIAQVQAGLSFPQVVAVGDVNTGGVQYSGGALYPSPVFPTATSGVSTINGPAIQGAFVNNTRQGFTVGNGVGAINSSAIMGGVAGNTMLWEAWIPDFGT